MKRLASCTLVVAALVSAFSSCASDDGANVRGTSCGASSGSGSASGSGSGAGSGSCASSGSGISNQGSTDNVKVNEAVAAYDQWVRDQIDGLLEKTKVFTDAVRANDVAAAKAAFAPSRENWEAIEPIAGLVPDIDGAVDSRVDDFASVNDPKFTGWHRLEYLLWEKGTTDGGTPFADELDAELMKLKTEFAKVKLTPIAVAQGSAELIEEVSEGKITGEEDRYSHTDLWDFAANVAGAEKAFELLKPAVNAADADLAADLESDFDDIDAALAKYEEGEGYQSYEALSKADKGDMQAILGSLSENLAKVPGVLKLG
ncbi:MAG: EfeM/EfeO family lipoprotein [Acidimicrobiia bacterium]|nr:EfeM/EfeO family lipoprotein [Acidimicrobiia bacterium]